MPLEDISLDSAVGLAVAQQYMSSETLTLLSGVMASTHMGGVPWSSQGRLQDRAALPAAMLDLFRAICCAWPGELMPGQNKATGSIERERE
jgi:hypothetical protein